LCRASLTWTINISESHSLFLVAVSECLTTIDLNKGVGRWRAVK
jgi:hypothetical protein